VSLGRESVDAWCGLARAAALEGDTAAVEEARQAVAALDREAAARLASWLEASPPSA
jgi:hypothetical protein